jgi:ribose-phosphate pyrophosphokinase
LRSNVAIVFKRRPEPDVSEVTEIVGHVDGKIAVVVDDMISTGGTLAKAAEALIKRGATEVYTCATHGIFAGDAIRVLNESPISKVIVTNTLPSNDDLLLSPKFKVLSIAQILADAIKRITANRSVSELFAKDDEGGEPRTPPPANAIGLPNLLIPASSATR